MTCPLFVPGHSVGHHLTEMNSQHE
jgi:hypothetical protein